MKYSVHFFDFFLPRFCPACRTKLSTEEEVVCEKCLSKIKRADPERLTHEYERKFLNDEIISGFTSLFVFEKDKELQQIIHELKYNGKFSVGTYLGKLIAKQLYHQLKDWKLDLIIPVPLHHLKRAERGYNQSDFIGLGIKSIMKIPIKTNLLKRIRFTETQTNLNLTERKENMNGAFGIKKRKPLFNKNVLILDDVITTGATISECGRMSLEYGASKVFAASVALAD